MPEASIPCTRDTKAEVEKYKVDNGFETYDAALRDMLVRCKGQRQPAPVPLPHAQEVLGQKQPKEHQPLSFKLLRDEDDTMTYFTGLCKDSRDWLLPRLKEKVGTHFVLLCFHD